VPPKPAIVGFGAVFNRSNGGPKPLCRASASSAASQTPRSSIWRASFSVH